MFGFLFKKNKGLDKESKASLKQSAKDLLGRRNSASATSNGSGIILTCSTNSSSLLSLHKKNSVDSLLGAGIEKKEFLERLSPSQTSVPECVSSDSLYLSVDGSKLEESDSCQKLQERFCSVSQSSSGCALGDSGGDSGIASPDPKGQNHLETCSSGEEISRVGSGSGSEDGLLKSLMSDCEIEFIDETLNLDNDCQSKESSLEERELKDTERKAMVQLDELRSKLISKETELSLLQADINMLAVDRDNKVMEIEGMSTQLQALRDENDMSLRRIRNLESDLEDLRVKNNQLSDDLLKKAEQLRCFDGGSIKMNSMDSAEFQLRIKDYEGKLRDLESEKNKILKERQTVEVEREEEIKALQEALDDSTNEKTRLQTKYDHDFAELQSANTSLMDDFEWKLRQIEASCKKKIVDKDKQIQEKIKEVKDNMSEEYKREKERLEQERHQLQEQLNHVAHLKSHEVELTQLRGLTHEQEKSLRSASRQIEQLKLNEKILQDETRTLRKLLDQEKAHLTVIQNSAQRRMDFHEENLKSKLEKQKNDINSNWEDKLREECSKLKRELNRHHADEKQLAIDTTRVQKDQEITSAKHGWEKQRQELQHEISKLKEEISKKEAECLREISRATTISDRENMDLRRRMEKLSMAHLEELDDVRANHGEEMDILKQRYESIIARLEKLEKKLCRYEKQFGYLVDEGIGLGIHVKGDSTSLVDTAKNKPGRSSDDDEDEEEEEEEEEEEDEEEEESKSDSEDKAVIDNKNQKSSSESLGEYEDDDEEEEDEDSSDKNVVYVVEVKDVPPTSLTVAEIKAEDKRNLIEPPTPISSSSFTSTSSESESDPTNQRVYLSLSTTNSSCSVYPEQIPNPPARRKSSGVRGNYYDGTYPRMGPYGKSRSATMTNCIVS